MVYRIVSNIITKGIKNFSTTLNLNEEKIQIRMYYNQENKLNYDICVEYQPKKTVSFKEILNLKLDILGREKLAMPVLEKSMKHFSDEYEIKESELSIFFVSIGKSISLCVFKKDKHVRIEKLSEFLEKIGLN